MTIFSGKTSSDSFHACGSHLKKLPHIFAAAAFLAATGMIPGLCLMEWTGERSSLSVPLVACMAVIAFLRIAMTIPGACINVFATARTLDCFLVANAAGLLSLILIYQRLTALGMDSDVAVAIGSISNWTFRTAGGWAFSLVSMGYFKQLAGKLT